MVKSSLCASCKWATVIKSKATGLVYWCEQGNYPSVANKFRCKYYITRARYEKDL